MTKNILIRRNVFMLCMIFVISKALAFTTYTDSITGVILTLPDSVEISKNKSYEYNKCNISTPTGNYISIYSVVNSDGESYSWDYLNKFDKKYGKPYKSEKLTNGLDGWIRYYNDKTSKDTPFIRCVTLIRGDKYAFYMVENAYSTESLISKYIIDHSKFPNSDPTNKGPRNNTNQTLPLIIFSIIIIALCILLWYIRKHLSKTIKISIIIIFPFVNFYLMYWPFNYTMFNSVGSSIFIGIISYWVLWCKSSDEFWKHIEKTLENVD